MEGRSTLGRPVGLDHKRLWNPLERQDLSADPDPPQTARGDKGLNALIRFEITYNTSIYEVYITGNGYPAFIDVY